MSGVSAIESTLRGGRGVAVETIPGFDYQASANVRCSLVEDAREAGVLAIGSSVTAHAVEVRAIRQGLNSYAAGFAHQALIGFEVESAFTATHCEVTDVDGFGLVSIGEHSGIHDSIIDGIQSWPDTELYGDGVAVVSFRIGDVYVHPASADVTGSIVRHSVRAGISSFGGNVTIADDLLDCNAITLNGFERRPW